MMLNISRDKLLLALNVVLGELRHNFYMKICVLVKIFIFIYVELDYNELERRFDCAPIKALEEFFEKCWTKEYLSNPLVRCILQHVP